jgi:S1-C subfamily serine protease
LRKTTLFAALGVAALVFAAAGLAITNGGPDGNGHPYVGALLAPKAFSDGTWEECSGTLISPTVFLTAAHCDEGLSQVKVTFDSTYDSATGTTYTGTWHADPGFNHAQGHPDDIAVVVFDQPVTGITPAELPTLGQLDSLKVGTPIVSVGYGAQSVTKGPGGHVFHYADVRYVATGSLDTTTPVWLKASMNPAKGDGGTCYGDSGGPNFIGDSDVIGGTTVTGDFYCRATNVDFRLDTPDARAFLQQYVKLP